MKKRTQDMEPLAEWATRVKLTGSSVLRMANEMEAQGVPVDMVEETRALALDLSTVVDRVVNIAAELIDLADALKIAVDTETLRFQDH